jgi:TRAP-type C4-dicarboxylate transport system permease small subunit
MPLITLSDKISKFLMVAAAAWAFGLTFLILADIIGRGAFNQPVQGTAEIVTASIVIIVFLQAGYAIRSRSMLRADFLVVKFPQPVQRVLLAVGNLLGMAFFLMIITGGWDESVLSWVENEFEGEGALRVPAWPARWTVIGGSALALINYAVIAYIDVFKPEIREAETAIDAPPS